jgi:hypothetical protein
MAWVYEELKRLGVGPVGTAPDRAAGDAEGAELRDRVVRRAWQIMQAEGWLPTPPTEAASVPG